jgi:methyltransferase-like protein/2-polyprenyl-3-methyl-5-hydroxy-6-metoxy-1,4-benzoquinol methylase
MLEQAGAPHARHLSFPQTGSFMTDTAQNPYDQILYPEAVFAQTHPDRLCVLATLMGLSPAPVETARILELGCGTGGNIIPLAYQYPGSTCVGIDYAARQIAIGDETIAALNLPNIRLIAQNFLDVDAAALGQFDYIITHGIYSWVPAEVQARILSLTKSLLAPNGVAYISYNVLPGWRMYGIGRELMQFRTRGITDPKARTEAARSVLNFVAGSGVKNEGGGMWARFMTAYNMALSSQSEYLATKPDELLFHDELEENNEAVYFSEFMRRAKDAGLEFLAESYFPYNVVGNLPSAVQEGLSQISGDLLELEQYMDFLRCRTFRQTLLVHDDVPIDRQINPQRIVNLVFASNMRRRDPQPDQKQGAVSFITRDGEDVFSTDDAFTIACFDLMIEAWPSEYGLAELTRAARERAYAYQVPPRTQEAEAYTLASNVLVGYGRSQNIVEIRATHAPCSITQSERPMASALARYQAVHSGNVTNQRHERVVLDETARFLIRHLDGTHDRHALIELMRRNVVIPSDKTEGEIRMTIATELEQMLVWMARSALLVR